MVIDLMHAVKEGQEIHREIKVCTDYGPDEIML